MAGPFSFMLPGLQEPEAPAPIDGAAGRGGLAPKLSGGLANFASNVSKGIDAVLSNPLYARLWSGVVSGQAQDPTAGPRALAMLQQNAIDRRTQGELMDRQRLDWQREDESYTTGRENALLRQRNIERLQQALSRGDQSGVRVGLAALDPVKAAEGFIAPPKAPTQRKLTLPGGFVQQQEFVDGRWVNVGEPGQPASLFDINMGEKPKLTDVRGLRSDYQTEAARFITAIEQLPMMRANAKLGTGAGDLGLVVAVAKIRDPNSVVREGEVDLVREDSSRFEDIKRAAARVNSGQLLLPEQRERLIRSIEEEVRSLAPAEDKRRKTYGVVASEYQIDPTFIYGPQSVDEQLRSIGIGQAAPDASESAPPDGVPSGSVQIGPGLWRTPDGRFLAED